jgi:non-specific serine/threonine protein kinase
VQRLVDQAVLQRQGEGEEPRFGMLETIREYGLARLAESGEEEAIRDAHAGWCLALAERAEPELAGPDQAIWVHRLETDLGNIRAALDWLARRGDVEGALRLAGAIGWFWSSAPYLEEARDRFDALLALPDAERYPAALAKVLNSAGDVADWQGDQARAQAHFERALAIYRAIDDRWRIVGMLRGLGSIAIDRGDLAQATALLEESLDLARAVGNEWEAAAAANLLGVVAVARGDLTTALARHEEAVAGWRRLGDTGHVITALTSVAWAALLDNARHRAATAFGEALQLAVAGDDLWYQAFSILGAGSLAASVDPRLAASLLAAGTERQERLGILLRPHVRAGVAQTVAAVRRHLGGDFAAHWEAGRALPTDAVLTEAAAVLAAAATESSRQEVPAGAQYGLTLRERDVLRLLVQGHSDKEIADTLFVTRRSASKYVSAVLAKLGVPSRTAAASLALRENLV